MSQKNKLIVITWMDKKDGKINAGKRLGGMDERTDDINEMNRALGHLCVHIG